jgi:subtilisin
MTDPLNYSVSLVGDLAQQLRAIPPLDDITPEWAWGGATGTGVKIAIIDSGIDASHAAVGGGVAGYVGITPGPSGPVFDREPHSDDYGHGTACAGIIYDLAPGAELYSIKVLGPRLSGDGRLLIAAIHWAIENGMHICNLSLGTTKREFFLSLHELSDQAYFRNVALVTAGNNLPVFSLPSACASTISVGSHDSDDADRVYYNAKPPVEFFAKGSGVRVAWLNGDWITATGNSYAAPHITGLVARIISKRPDLTVFQVKQVLRALATNTDRKHASEERAQMEWRSG